MFRDKKVKNRDNLILGPERNKMKFCIGHVTNIIGIPYTIPASLVVLLSHPTPKLDIKLVSTQPYSMVLICNCEVEMS